jgi:hypothetical protein
MLFLKRNLKVAQRLPNPPATPPLPAQPCIVNPIIHHKTEAALAGVVHKLEHKKLSFYRF